MNRWPPLRLILACNPTMISRHFLKDIHMHLSNRLFLEIIFDLWILWDGQWTQIHAPCWICFVLSLLKTSKIKIFVHLCLPLLLFLKCCDHTWKKILQMFINNLYLKTKNVSHFILCLVAAGPSYWKISLFQM